jgi:hypothetical protein
VTRNYQVKVELADPPAGMFLGATILGRLKLKAESVIEIPSSALTMIENKPAVWVSMQRISACIVGKSSLRAMRRTLSS